jgi:hypothetical protein
VNPPFRVDWTDTITTSLPREDRQPIWPIWRIAVPVLTLLFVLYPAVMALPHHGPMIAPIAPPETLPMQRGVRETCPPVDLCVGVAVEQALPRLPVPPLLLLALVVLILATRERMMLPARPHDWWWPPDRRRALLQVFLI